MQSHLLLPILMAVLYSVVLPQIIGSTNNTNKLARKFVIASVLGVIGISCSAALAFDF